MKRGTLIAVFAAVMIMACSVFSFADGGFELVSSYPEDGQTNTSMENLGVKLTFSKALDSEAAQKANETLFTIVDEDGQTVPIKVLFKDKLVLVVADADAGFVAKNNADYTLTIGGELIDNDGNILGSDVKVSFKTYNQKINNMVNMGMMFVMFGGIMFFSMRQNNNQKEEEEAKKNEAKKAAFNPYKEAQKTGKSVEEVKAEQAKKEAKIAKRLARKNKGKEEAPQEKKIENCAEYLNNVYHVHAPAPTNKEDRSIEAMRAAKKAEAKAEKEAKAARAAKRKK